MDTEKKVVEYVDITPTWEGILPALLAIYVDGDSKGRAHAITELQRMAKAADAYGALLKSQKEASDAAS